jgi:bifunctional DNase/RNase
LNKVEVEILGLSANSSTGGAYALLLKEIYGSRRLPVLIGTFEAQSIALELEGIKPPRPLTHDLLKSVIDHLGGTIIEVQITELRDSTFYGKIIIEIAGLTNEIDSRPSDAIALAVRANVPIYVNEEVMKVAAIVPTSSEDESPNEEDFNEEDFFAEKTSGSKEARIAVLQDLLRKAIEKEDYERAAKLRDEINKLTGKTN